LGGPWAVEFSEKSFRRSFRSARSLALSFSSVVDMLIENKNPEGSMV